MLKQTKFAKSISGYVGKFFAWLPLHPNAITILSMIMALFGYISWLPELKHMIQSIVFFLFAFFFDVIDGAVARVKKLQSKQGAFLDGVADRVVEFFLILTLSKMFLFNQEIQMLLMAILFFGTGMTSFIKAYAEHSQILKHDEAIKLGGLFERPERSIALLLIFLLATFSYFDFVKILLYLTGALSVITTIERFWYVYSKK